MPSMTTMTTLRAKALAPQRLEQLADWLAVGVAVSLPWSTSATGILIVLWLVAVLPTLDTAAVRRELATAAGGLPVLLWALAAVGMLWADVTWSERFGGLGGYNRLLVIPLLLAQFRRSAHGIRVLRGFFASVSAVLLLSWALVVIPGLPWRGNLSGIGVPVKDYILQSEDFLICAFVLFGIVFDDGRARRWRSVAGLVALAGLFLANIVFVAAARTTLLVAPVLVLLLGWRQFGWKGLLGAALLGCIVGVTVFLGSPYLRARLTNSVKELQAYRASDAFNSTGLHLEFLKKSFSFVETAPVIGHGTGSIPEQFRNAAVGQSGAASVASVNPHNQIFAVAIQLGLVGAAVLAAMWTAHVMLFRGGGMTAWIGIIIVVQNVAASLVNSHLFDFTQGWLYVFGVGVAGGMALRERPPALPSPACGGGKIKEPSPACGGGNIKDLSPACGGR
jgi:O-antigen ligase